MIDNTGGAGESINLLLSYHCPVLPVSLDALHPCHRRRHRLPHSVLAASTFRIYLHHPIETVSIQLFNILASPL